MGIVALTVIGGSWYTVDQTERGVILRNGKIIGVAQPGLGFKVPWIDKVVDVDVRSLKMVYGVDQKGASIMEAYSRDGQPAFLRVSVVAHADPTKVAELYERFAGDVSVAFARTIEPHVFARAKVVFGQYTATNAIERRGPLNDAVLEAIKDAMGDNPVLIVENVQIENISFSAGYIKSIEARMEAEVEVQRFRQQLEREKVQASIIVTQAQARADSLLAERKAEADGIKLVGDAQAQAIQARAKALGDNPNLVLLTQAERWNGTLPTTMLPGNGVPMIALGGRQ